MRNKEETDSSAATGPAPKGVLPPWPGVPWLESGGRGPRILGINPWIFDFAAFNLWMRPLGLLACLEMCRQCGADIALLDCLDQTWRDQNWPKPNKFGAGRYPKTPLPNPKGLERVPRRFSRYGLDPNQTRTALAKLDPPPDMVLISVSMTYWFLGAQEAATMARSLWPSARIILGGTYASLCQGHALACGLYDLVLSGPLERPDNWNKFWGTLPGRTTIPDLPPRAGLSLALDLYPAPGYGPVLGSRGCPFSCDYCAISLLYPGHAQRTGPEVIHEFEAQLERGARNFAFFDDALLVRPQTYLLPLLERALELNPPVNFHTPNALHLRFLTPEICRRLKRAGLAAPRLGLESLDFEHRNDRKVSRTDWDQGGENLVQAGYDPGDVGVYVLFGLPDQDLGQVRETIRKIKKREFTPILTHYSPIPGVPLFRRAAQVSPYPIEENPLFQNNSIWPCYPGGFSWKEKQAWSKLIRG